MELIKDINDQAREAAEKQSSHEIEIPSDTSTSDTKNGKSIADYMADIAQKDVDKT